MIVQLHAGHAAYGAVEESRRQDLVPGVVAHLLPTADDVEALLELGDETRDLVGIVLEVGIQRHHNPALRGLETGLKRGCLSNRNWMTR